MLSLVLVMFASPTERTLTTKHLADKGKYVQTLSFVLNSLSKSPTIHVPIREGDEVKFDLDNYKIDPEVYDKVIKNDRVDSFIFNATRFEIYNKLLGVNNISNFKKLVCLDEATVKNLYLEKYAIVLSGKVVRNELIIRRKPTLLGSFWQDSNKDEGENYAASLPNGLQAYAKSEKSVMFNNVAACMICHEKGVHKFENELDLLKKYSKIEVRLITPIRFIENEDVKIDQDRFTKALKQATTLKPGNFLIPEQNAKQLDKLLEDYEKPLNIDDAAKELDMTTKQLETILLKSTNPALLSLLRLRITRDTWEAVRHAIKN